MLLGTRPGYADAAAAGNRESYRRGAVSLPSSRAGEIGLSSLLPPDLQNLLETGHGLLRSKGATVAALDEVGDACFMDARVARLGRDYGHLLNELHAAGVIEQCEEPLEFSGVFFVKRKDTKQRLIFDTRRSNFTSKSQATRSWHQASPSPAWRRRRGGPSTWPLGMWRCAFTNIPSRRRSDPISDSSPSATTCCPRAFLPSWTAA